MTTDEDDNIRYEDHVLLEVDFDQDDNVNYYEFEKIMEQQVDLAKQFIEDQLKPQFLSVNHNHSLDHHQFGIEFDQFCELLK